LDVKDWFEVKTDPDDPTNITMRRMTDEEAAEAHAEKMRHLVEPYFTNEAWLQHLEASMAALAEVLKPTIEAVSAAFANVAPWEDPNDPKAAARRRSKADLDKKRRELYRRHGKL
jgi:hypothetical protein